MIKLIKKKYKKQYKGIDVMSKVWYNFVRQTDRQADRQIDRVSLFLFRIIYKLKRLMQEKSFLSRRVFFYFFRRNKK